VSSARLCASPAAQTHKEQRQPKHICGIIEPATAKSNSSSIIMLPSGTKHWLKKHRGFRRKKVLSYQVVLFLGLLAAVYIFTHAIRSNDDDDTIIGSNSDALASSTETAAAAPRLYNRGRQLMADSCNKTDDGPATSNFPKDAFTSDEKAKGAILLHVLALLYMFVGLAIICDSYFEASLEGICEDLKYVVILCCCCLACLFWSLSLSLSLFCSGPHNNYNNNNNNAK
jgi:hypothetical protein